jgi:hypothetical protein
MSKYAFGLALARQFGFDESLVIPATLAASGLAAQRAPQLTLKADKLARALGEAPPGGLGGLARLHILHQHGWQQRLRALGTIND